jgi:pectate lyase C
VFSLKKGLKLMLILASLLSLIMIITLCSINAVTYYKFQNRATGLFIDGMGSAANGANCCQWSGSSSYNQQWELVASGSNFKLKNRTTGLYLDGMGRTSNGSIVGQWSSGSSNNQVWIRETTGSYVKFKNLASGLYIDGMGSTGNGSNLCQWSGSSSYNQQFLMSTVGSANPTPTPGGGGTKYITSTIIVAAGQTYDGGNQTIICQGMGDGSQAENQKAVFRLENGASLRNVIIGFPACDGIHCYGNNNVYNVRINDIGEDALTVKGTETVSAGTINVDGGFANKGDDKVFQVNAPCTLKVSNFSSDGMGKLCRQNGGTTFTMTLYLTNVTCKNVKEAIFRTDSNTSQCYYRNLTVTNFMGSNGWWYGRDSQAHPY